MCRDNREKWNDLLWALGSASYDIRHDIGMRFVAGRGFFISENLKIVYMDK